MTRKIHSLRNQFNTELEKINSKKSGQGSDDNYETKWPYFKNLLFIKTSLQTRQTTGNMEQCDERENALSASLEDINEESTSDSIKEKNQETSKPVKKKAKIIDDKEELLAKARSSLSNDEYDIFGLLLVNLGHCVTIFLKEN
ncbi:unnamed protein product [Acanthoscelides obtectus]|uniref:MADF domain-containing protein n=1 Tax=Acanthoscelides obtectus TaxID=200917 RepID=A0A9P0JU61_ACAOB|nr:unnamed protein product [Acanthoscelides obtectus]CAK1663841.1 hypothetical protein AOBTE_LOCUS23887 [Acanthoscelides obtectus]